MIIKDKRSFSKWQFYLEDPDGIEMCLPSEDSFANSYDELLSLVLKQIDQFPAEYKQQITINATKLSMTFYKYVQLSVEHQICIRQENPHQDCWDGGLGDKIHTFSGKIDTTIDNMPEFLKPAARTLVKAATLAATGKPQARLGSCSSCGGTRTFTPKQNAVGRAGFINTIVPNKINK